MTSPDERADRPHGGPLDLFWRILGGVAATWGGAIFALLEMFLVPLRIAGHRVPVTLLLAVVTNIGLMAFARYVTRNRFVGLLPGIVWFVIAVVMSGQTDAGDTILVGNDWVPLALLGIGTVAVIVGAYRSVVTPRPR